MNPILLAFIAGTLTSAGLTFQNLDTNSTGKDDVAGLFLVAGADIAQGLAQGNESRFDKGIIAANKVTAQYMKSKGLTPAS
jgi:hypothetical protein